MKRISISEGAFVFGVESVTRVEGEATVNIRKGKQIVLFTFEIEVQWILTSQGIEVAKGTFKLPEFDQGDLDDFDLQFKSETPGTPSASIKSSLLSQLRPLLKSIFSQLMTSLMESSFYHQHLMMVEGIPVNF